MMRRWAALMIVGSTAVAGLSGCGSNDGDTAALYGLTDQSMTTTSTSNEPAESTEPAPFDAERFISWDLEHPDGHEARVKLEIGAPVLPEDVEGLGSELSSLADVCSVDAERDVFVPLKVSVSNLTYEFTTAPTVTISNPYGHMAIDETTKAVDSATRYRNGDTKCRRQTDSMADEWLDVKFELRPSETLKLDYLAILRNYRTPATPNGDPEAFNKAAGWVKVIESGNQMQHYLPTCIDTDAGNVWTGKWTAMPRAHFALLNVEPQGFLAADDIALPSC
jgi:hypothetical protein